MYNIQAAFLLQMAIIIAHADPLFFAYHDPVHNKMTDSPTVWRSMCATWEADLQTKCKRYYFPQKQREYVLS